MASSAPFSLRAFGLSLAADFQLPMFRPIGAGDERADVELTLATPDAVRAAWSGDGTSVWRTVGLGDEPFEILAGAGGDHLFAWGDGAPFHLNGAADRLLCVPDDGPADWQRLLLDTVLYSIALVRKGAALHGSAVALGHGAAAILSAAGSGKTTLALELIRRGGRLLTDDVLFVEPADGRALGEPGPPLLNVPFGAEIDGVTTPLMRFEDAGEAWSAIEHVSSGPTPLAAIVLLDRRAANVGARIEAVPASPVPLMPHLIYLAHVGAPAERFTVLADLVDLVPVARLETDLTTPPARLAELVEGFCSDGS
jgi:hypothetical protein